MPKKTAPPTTLDQRMERFRRRAAVLGAFSRGIRWLAVWGLGWGALVLVARAGLGWDGAWPLWGLSGVPGIFAVALFGAWRARPGREQVRALFDDHHGHGGLLMAAGEKDIGAWAERLPRLAGSAKTRPPDPRLRWRDPGALGRLALALGFLLAAVLLPIPRPAADPRPLAIDERVQGIEEKIEQLAEEELLDERTRRDLELDLAKVAEEADAHSPARAWETLDHLDESLARHAAEGADAVAREGQRLAALDAVADGLEQAGLDPELRQGALDEVRAMTAEAAAADRLLGDALARQLAALAAELGEGSGAASFERLRAALGEGLGELGDTLERLRESGLIDLQTLQRAQRLLERRDDSSLIRYLTENKKPKSVQVCEGGSGPDGRGGVQRGPGHAPLALDGDPSPEGLELIPEMLGPAGLAALEKSRLLGVSVAAPTPEDGLPAAGGALDGVSAGAGGARTRDLLPQHRRTVERFFERTQPANPTTTIDPEGDPNG